MKKIIIAGLIALALIGCSVKTDEAELTMNIISGHYYTSGEVVTEDGNVWGYSQDVISEAPSYDNQPVYVLMYDAGTPDNIYDDEIVGLVAR